MVQKFGLTWWGQRWIAALEALGAVYENRLPRGRSYARQGAVHDLSVAPGVVTAKVDGNRARPYRVRLALPVFDDGTWEAIASALTGQIRHATALLEGVMPDDVDTTLADCGVSLFPTAGELDTRCSCPDVANPCKHVAAVHYLLATSFDADPFLLMALRGRERQQLLAALRAARAGTPDAADEPDIERQRVGIDEIEARDLFRTPEPLTLTISPHPDGDPLATMHRLGPLPPAVAGAQRAVEATVVAIADHAWRLLSAADPDV